MRHRLVLAGLALGLIASVGATLHVGSSLAAPVQRRVGPPPATPPLERIAELNDAWFAEGERGAGGIVLLHGVRADRRSMLGRAKFLHEAGYSVLLADMQAHGENVGERITFGVLEAEDARAAVEFLRERLPGQPVAVIGTSLGGAACLLGASPLDVDALVLEAVYPDVRRAVRNRLRMRMGRAGAWLAPLLTVQMKTRLGIDPDRLRPIDRIGEVIAPVLIVAGETDRRTTLEESMSFFESAPEPKELWVVAGAAHVDLHRFAPVNYEARVLDFLRRHLPAAVR